MSKCKKSNYDNIPVSDKTKKGMNLNIDDIGYIKRMFDRQDAANKDVLKDSLKKVTKRIYTDLGKVIRAENKFLTDMIKKQNEVIGEIKGKVWDIEKNVNDLKTDFKTLEGTVGSIKKDVDEKEERLKKVEKFASRKQTILRLGIAGFIVLLLAIIAALLIHYNLPVQ